MSDEKARQQALNPLHSYIVQAPAGSGKTELLTRRYLNLLKEVEQPEEVLAVTFTNKAAGEMRSRIINYLKQADYQNIDRWEISKNPHRLRIITIDAYCGYLASRLPILARFGCQPEIIEEPSILYDNASKALIKTLEDDLPWSNSLGEILSHLDNRYDQAITFFNQLLSNRDQWLPIILNPNINKLSKALDKIIAENLKKVNSLFNEIDHSELIELIHHAYSHVEDNNLLLNYHCPRGFPSCQSDQLASWKAISFFLLTKEGKWRKQINKTIGFHPKVHDHLKIKLKNILNQLNKYDADILYEIQSLPYLELTKEEYALINHLENVLPILVGYLKVQFKEQGKVDFIEVAEGALAALGELDSPSELALMLDYQIKHILIDEFQDTSVCQFTLFEKLISEWIPGDGRTLFLVGDPMQSIYHFRGAEVGLFLKVRDQGIGQLKPTPLYLTQNFRSSPIIVKYFNSLFSTLFPNKDDLSVGAIKFHHAHVDNNMISKSMNNDPIEPILIEGDSHEEATWIASEIREILNKNDSVNIGVLARTKKQLYRLRKALMTFNIPFQAEQLDKLIDKQAVIDLKSLVFALENLEDHLSWLAILRAPWCGLNLNDIYIIKFNLSGTIWHTLNDKNIISFLSTEGQTRISNFVEIINYWFFHRGKVSLREWIETLWYRLGGTANLKDMNEIEDVNVFFDLIDEVDCGGKISDILYLEKKLEQRFSNITSNEANSNYKISLMTIHKAKGLEFDILFLIGLNEKKARLDPLLFAWWERPTYEGVDLLLAPKDAIDNKYLLYHFILKKIRTKQDYELIRLLYVAMTRAKSKLYLVSHSKNAEIKFQSGSFLNALKMMFEGIEPIRLDEFSQKKDVIYQNYRLANEWKIPYPLPNLELETINHPATYHDLNYPENTNQLNYYAQLVGTIIHRIFYQIAEEGYKVWQSYQLENFHPIWRKWLMNEGLSQASSHLALKKINRSIKNFLNDTSINWMFEKNLSHVYNEWALCEMKADRVVTHIIDRAFVDKVGYRWIIDYKFLDYTNMDEAIVNYKPQLLRYKQLLNRYETFPVRCALYFPLEKKWWEMK